jgi:FKBP-type peptidyl-prolyl cis-trans isomerase FkpA
MNRLIISTIICLLATTSFAAESVNPEAKEAITTPSGLQYTSLKEGYGASPKPTDAVRVNYRGTLPNGREFDSSYKSGRPAEFQLNNVIKCWTEGLQMMKVGGKANLVCPSNIAYGDDGIPGSVPRFATLIFEVELLDIK